MTTPAPRVALGASTLNRKWWVDINTGTTAAPVWTGVHGINEFKSAIEPTLQDDSDFDSNGDKSQTVTARAWMLEMKVARKVTASTATAYDPGQEKLRLAAEETGVANSVQIRFYEMTTGGPRAEAYTGRAAVSWTPDGGGMDALDMVSIKLSGQGKRLAITHPSPTV